MNPQGRHQAHAMIQSPRLLGRETKVSAGREVRRRLNALVRVTREAPPTGREKASTTLSLERLEVCSTTIESSVLGSFARRKEREQRGTHSSGSSPA